MGGIKELLQENQDVNMYNGCIICGKKLKPCKVLFNETKNRNYHMQCRKVIERIKKQQPNNELNNNTYSQLNKTYE
jgi:hypothetical protein